ncbi:branched-chain amino acid transport system / permease component family protein [Anoxybacillus sp. B7M1]|jgi:D-xylose transport system permease protein|uniref:Xylose transport system permease protein XylH n=1 Tax=Anoxybacteroides rupiense TaxID=311460 RepID=A0ABD5IZ51_9BACL|nr:MULTISPECIES: sugar ABC transporter permease [Anoxybacillus]ANB56978.1 branched-chain amino acid transport system / permease component family protein [Anoxybacillus sp. B2M1]ANB65822.1 branched-chain amino acid transport system / permease component family protein [Anoxybacillus sp. B7M1]KXG10721.1 Xylose transport system permease protein XylH [Anoxybacillus sp. P3H1B]MBB3905988.1 D-xylose transport system permease protein [Anoxybacillus rupiensis]MBS2772860.1 sugar ABC transporter permease 
MEAKTVIHNEHTVEKKRDPIWGKIDIRAYTMIGALVVIWIFFGFLNDTFLSARNLSNLFTQMSVTAILAIGMVFVIVAGHIDLSVGSIVGLTGGLAAILSNWMGMPTSVVILGTLVAGALIGMLQGWLVAYRAIPAFIVTLGGMMVFRGVLMGITKSTTVPISDANFIALGSAYFTNGFGVVLAVVAIAALVISTIQKRRSRQRYGFSVAPLSLEMAKVMAISALIVAFVFTMNSYKGIPFPIIFVIGLALIFSFIANKTTFGRHVYAIGGNAEAARLSGIHIQRHTMILFVFTGLLSAIAAIVLTARLSSATISAGQMYELDAIAACVIGGTSLVGGSGTIIGAIIGAMVMTSLDNGMSLLGMETFWQYIVKGSILVLAVWIDIASRKKQARS